MKTTFTERGEVVLRTEIDETTGVVHLTEFYASHGDSGHVWARTPGSSARWQVCRGLKTAIGTLYLDPGQSLLGLIMHEHGEAKREKAEGKAYVRRHFGD